MVPLVKVRKHLHLLLEVGGGSESQRLMSAGSQLPKLFRKKGGGGLRLFGVSAVKQRHTVIFFSQVKNSLSGVSPQQSANLGTRCMW